MKENRTREFAGCNSGTPLEFAGCSSDTHEYTCITMKDWLQQQQNTIYSMAAMDTVAASRALMLAVFMFRLLLFDTYTVHALPYTACRDTTLACVALSIS